MHPVGIQSAQSRLDLDANFPLRFRALIPALRPPPLLPSLSTMPVQTGYEQHVKEGGCSTAKKGEQRQGEHADRLMRLQQLVSTPPPPTLPPSLPCLPAS